MLRRWEVSDVLSLTALSMRMFRGVPSWWILSMVVDFVCMFVVCDG